MRGVTVIVTVRGFNWPGREVNRKPVDTTVRSNGKDRTSSAFVQEAIVHFQTSADATIYGRRQEVICIVRSSRRNGIYRVGQSGICSKIPKASESEEQVV